MHAFIVGLHRGCIVGLHRGCVRDGHYVNSNFFGLVVR